MPNTKNFFRTRLLCQTSQHLVAFGLGLCRISVVSVLFMNSPDTGWSAKGNPQIASLCDRAAVQVSRDSGVPLDVLRAISRAETGRSSPGGLQPWPWTVNMEGTGRWFATLDEARSYVFSHFKNGARSFDVGCFQINYKWHGDAFRSIDDMFDPMLNAAYAAEFLNKLYREFGNWPDAAGAYHSRTLKYATKYSARFDQIRSDLAGGSELVANYQRDEGRLSNRKSRSLTGVRGPSPLTSGQVTLGSLVPITRQSAAAPQPFVVVK